jgi:8-oxo-dGTP diphosphatase
MLTIDLVRHMKAKNRQKWTAPQDERPLTKLGKRQADFQVEAMLQGDPIDALYTSPALRCTSTIAPLAARAGLEPQLEPALAEGRSFQQTMRLLDQLRERHPTGRIVLCSHGDTIPAMLAGVAASTAAQLPRELKGFGGWYRITLTGENANIARIDPPAGFDAL